MIELKFNATEYQNEVAELRENKNRLNVALKYVSEITNNEVQLLDMELLNNWATASSGFTNINLAMELNNNLVKYQFIKDVCSKINQGNYIIQDNEFEVKKEVLSNLKELYTVYVSKDAEPYYKALKEATEILNNIPMYVIQNTINIGRDKVFLNLSNINNLCNKRTY